MSTKSSSRIPRGPAVILGVTTVATVGAIIYSHYSQVRDKAIMREGVERDKERMRAKRRLQRENRSQSTDFANNNNNDFTQSKQ